MCAVEVNKCSKLPLDIGGIHHIAHAILNYSKSTRHKLISNLASKGLISRGPTGGRVKVAETRLRPLAAGPVLSRRCCCCYWFGAGISQVDLGSVYGDCVLRCGIVSLIAGLDLVLDLSHTEVVVVQNTARGGEIGLSGQGSVADFELLSARV